MIPVKLELTNFLSYRDTAEIDFTDIHLACVSGANGAGKSSIMDGITWALFGKSRSRSDDDLVNRYAARSDETAEVRFTFMLEGTTYRVIRRKRVGKTGLLELQMGTPEGTWRPLTESKLRETGAAIEHLLRMNYDTFINASFLLQGKADEFTTRTDSERKEILADLLGANQWEAYRAAANEVRRKTEGEAGLIDGRLQEILSELNEEGSRQEALAAAQAQQQVIADKLRLREDLLQQTRQTAAALEQLRRSVIVQESAVQRAETNLKKSQDTLAARELEQEKWSAILADKEAIVSAFAQWQEADLVAQTQQELANQYNRLRAQMAPLELIIGQQQSRLEAQRETLRDQSRKVAAALEDRQEVEKRILDLNAKMETLQREKERLSKLQEELDNARAQLQQTEGERRLYEQDLAGLQEQARRIDAVSADRAALQKSQEQARVAMYDLEEKVEVIISQREHFAQIKAEIEAIRNQQPMLHEKMNQLKERLDQLNDAGSGGVCPVCGQALSDEHRQEAMATLEQDGTAHGDLYRANKKRLAALEIELAEVEKTMAQGQRLETQLQQQRQLLVQSETRLEELARQEEDWVSSGQERLVNAAAILADKSTLDAQTAEVARLLQEAEAGRAVQQQVDTTQSALAEARAQLNALDQLIRDWTEQGQGELTAVSELLAQQTFAQEERSALEDLRARAQDIGYDEGAHQAALAAREALSGTPERYQNLQQAETAQISLATTLADLAQQISQQTLDLESQRLELEEAKVQVAVLTESSQGLPALEDEVTQLREQEIAASAKVGQALQSVAVLETLRKQRDGLVGEKQQLAQRVQRLKVLEMSCGPKGVQALLIEQAVPEIEDRANDLLERLTGGDMRIRFDTQRQKKSSDAMMETLDIIIEDRNGQRPYENYSGGEQFRINFAIRLALSELLTHRTGARLQTLVVDEGFGSQDPLGRQRLIEAINAVSDDFKCILVITHVDELRDAFPTRIEVQKGASGSQISVS